MSDTPPYPLTATLRTPPLPCLALPCFTLLCLACRLFYREIGCCFRTASFTSIQAWGVSLRARNQGLCSGVVAWFWLVVASRRRVDDDGLQPGTVAFQHTAGGARGGFFQVGACNASRRASSLAAISRNDLCEPVANAIFIATCCWRLLRMTLARTI